MIDRALRRLYNQTMLIIENLEDTESEDLTKLVAMRNQVITSLQAKEVISEEEKQMIREMSVYDHVIVGKMNAIKEDAALNLRKIRHYHTQNNAYGKNNVNPYLNSYK